MNNIIIFFIDKKQHEFIFEPFLFVSIFTISIEFSQAVCPTECLHNGNLNTATCLCECYSAWEGNTRPRKTVYSDFIFIVYLKELIAKRLKEIALLINHQSVGQLLLPYIVFLAQLNHIAHRCVAIQRVLVGMMNV